ncbi:MAG: ABC transporter permease [Deltaproteobacteria bacterium]|nr:ABC transporter permease [Deltaproteobacteria bacterium]
MRGFYAIFHKELANFFVSPIAYAVIGCFLLVSGFFFWANVSFLSLLSLQASASPMFAERINMTDVVVRPFAQNMGIVLLFVLPLLTMRLFSEEKRSGCIELLLTYPISDVAVMLGKFVASLLVVVIMLAGTVPSFLLLLGLGSLDWGPVIGGYLSLLLMGGAFISLGLFISSLTENQIISAAISFVLALLFWILSWSSSFTGAQLGYIISQLSILEHMDSLNKGVLALSDVSFFVLFTAFFLFLTMRSLETHRWRG